MTDTLLFILIAMLVFISYQIHTLKTDQKGTKSLRDNLSQIDANKEKMLAEMRKDTPK